MGSRMAANLVRAGFEVTVWNRTAAKAEAFCAEHAAKMAATPAQAAAGSEFVITMVVNAEQVQAVLLGENGVADAADINFASSVAEQYGRYGVRINTVNPGPVNTDRWDGLEKALARDKKIDQKHAHELALSSIPFHRLCEPGEVASLVTFLASPRASFINGAHIPIDGAQRKALMDI